MEQVTVPEFKARCPRSLERVRQTGEPIEILKNGALLAIVHPPSVPTRKAAFSALKSTLRGPVEDGVEPLRDADGETLKDQPVAQKKLLLATQIWLGYLPSDARISSTNRSLIESEDSIPFLSPMSVWEVHLLIEKGRLPVSESPSDWIQKALATPPVREANLTLTAAVLARKLHLSHQDPRDRFIAATASDQKLVLITDDRRLRECHELNTPS